MQPTLPASVSRLDPAPGPPDDATLPESLAPLATIRGSLDERIEKATKLQFVDFLDTMERKARKTTVEASVHSPCNQKCAHCFFTELGSGQRSVTPADILRMFSHLDPERHERYPYPLETTLTPELFQVYEEIGQNEISTNGIRLALQPEILDEMRARGIETIVVSLHGNEEEHCVLTRVTPKIYGDLMTALRLIVEKGFRLQVITALYKRNMYAPLHLHQLLRDLGVSRWYIHRIIPTGMARLWPLEEFLRGQECREVMRQYLWLRQRYRDDELHLGLDLSWGPNFFSAAVLKNLAGQRQRWPESKYLCPAVTTEYQAVSMDTGKVYQCFHLQSFPESQIGQLDDDLRIGIDRSNFDEESLRTGLRGNCANTDCPYHQICLGGCRATAFSFAVKRGEEDPFMAGQDFCLTRAIEQDLEHEVQP